MNRIIIITIFALIAVPVLSQTEEVILPSDLKQQTIITEPATLHKGFLRAGFVASYGVIDKYFNDESKKEFFPESAWASSWGYTLLVQYGITEKLTAGFWLPYVNETRNYYQVYIAPGYNTDQENSWDLKGRGLGDICFSAKYQILTETETSPSLTGALNITVPTGEKNPTNITGDNQYDLPTGGGVLTLCPEFRVRKISYPFSYIAYVSYLYHLPGTKLYSAQDSEETSFQFGSRIDAGVSLNFHLNDWIAVTNDINYFYSGKGEQENVPEEDLTTSWAVSYEARLVFQIRKVRLAEAVRIPIKGNLVSADPLYVILLQYTF
ncbi:MAG: hypothetical protein K8R35_03915 [Bacteroidales bacterium]|nr:hypothetical protein [Bacteroidales bacterium]